MKYINIFCLFLLLVSQPVLAQEKEGGDILYGVLAQAYQNNPTIKAARAEFLAVQEQVTQAQSGYRPKITADADVTYTDTKAEGSSFAISEGSNTSKSASLNLNQPLYRGGSTQADIAEAYNIVAAQQFSLSAIEQSTLYDSVVAYMDLYRDRAVLDLRENNVKLVLRELEQAQARFHVGELTRTDVSQSEARLAAAKADLINAQAALKTSRALFERVVGAPPPADVDYPLIRFDVPQQVSEAIDLAQSNNREVLQAQFNKQAAVHRIGSIKGELLPQVSAIGRLDKTYDQSDFIEEQRQAAIGVTASVPLYTGGATRSRIRQAQKIEQQRAVQVDVVRKRIKQEVVRDWEIWQAAKAETQARQAQVEAAKVAQEGVHYETEFGERTTLDSLNANQELLTAQVDLVTSRRNEIVARFAIAKSLGLLVPKNLGFLTIQP